MPSASRAASACASFTAASGALRAVRSSPKTRSGASRELATEVAQGERDREEDRRAAGAELQPYVDNFVTPMMKNPTTVSQTDRQAWCAGDRRQGQRGQGADGVVSVSVQPRLRVEVLRVEQGSYIEQEVYTTTPTISVTARVDDVTLHAQLPGARRHGRLGDRRSVATSTKWPSRSRRTRSRRCTAKPLGASRLPRSDAVAVACDADDSRDRRPCHRDRSRRRLRGELRRHELRQALGRRQAEVRVEALQHQGEQDRLRPAAAAATTTTA